ncbi:MAG: hypothetical protein ABNH17_05585 [Paracoccus sp. (in: a-proteobacteria)]|jgi:hypothetical protein|uniref:hypothetical protein n=1 Tax=Paracoccus sp. TaxID=267 RepID=UPI0032D915B7
MTPTWKRGSTVQILLDQFTDEEWAAIYPWTASNSEARYPGGTQSLAVMVDEEARTILLSADTAGWPVRLMKADLLIERAGASTYVPAANFFEFQITQPATEAN